MSRRRVQEIKNDRSRSRSREKQERSRSEESEMDDEDSDVEESEVVANYIRNAFITFFASLGREKGFVFTKQDRQKLIKEQARSKRLNRHGRFINWASQVLWQESDQLEKIQQIFKKRNPTFANDEKREQAKDILEKVSYIFCPEVTKELYQLLMLLLEESLKPVQDRLMPGLMDQVYAAKTRFTFFGFQFSKYFQLPKDTNLVKNAYHELGMSILNIFQEKFSKND